MTLLALKNLYCHRGYSQVFDNLSFELASGGIIHLQGSNGSGKTSLLQIAAGLLKARCGIIDVSARYHYIGVDNALSSKISVESNLRFLSKLCGAKVLPQHIKLVLEKWGLAQLAPLPVGILSAGQKRAVSLARLQLVERPLWLLDEVFAQLDQQRSAVLTRLIEKHLAKGGGVVIAEHHNDFAFLNMKIINMDEF